ncbi:MAG: XisH family protein [Roseiflexaceae bacterium]
MPQRDSIHDIVKQALINNEWEITYDPYVISYGERFLFVDLGAKQTPAVNEGLMLGAQRAGRKIAVEIKEFRGASPIADLEQAIGQYMLYRLLLNKVDPERELFLAITNLAYDEIFSEPIGEVVINDLPLQLLVVDVEKAEVQRWIPAPPTATS